MSKKQSTGSPKGGDREVWGAYLQLWQYFEDHGDVDKGRMISVVTWILGIAIGILGYITTKLLGYTPCCFFKNATSVWVFSLFGLFVTVFAASMVIFFSLHANNNFKIGGRCAEKLPRNMKALIDQRKPEFHRAGQFGQQRSSTSLHGQFFGSMVGKLFPVYFWMSCILAGIFVLLFALSFGDA